jgi:hypothetical protein
MNLEFLSNLGSDQPFITASRPAYENLLGKTKNNFSEIPYFQKNLLAASGTADFLKNATNLFFFNFPFLLAPKSDMGRYI